MIAYFLSIKYSNERLKRDSFIHSSTQYSSTVKDSGPNQRFTDDFRRNKSQLIRLKLPLLKNDNFFEYVVFEAQFKNFFIS